jgi:hypothetical protein
MSDLEKRVADLERRLARIEPHVNRSIPLGPSKENIEQIEANDRKRLEGIVAEIKKDTPPVDRSKCQLTDGSPVPEDGSHTALKANGQQDGYVVLSPDERAKGFVRPVRRSYRHVGVTGPKQPLRELTAEERQRYDEFGYVKFEPYPESDSPLVGRYWTQKQLDSIGTGCGTITTMGHALAETYARDPKFYGGTFCVGCGTHLPLDEFVWNGTDERVGS